ncbi:hypothetical protein [Streptomyces sp. 8L]|uniref:hypothetical protein n=1 Tax=Streptomyces sp. 8L TaxID=2877242 RepID=UPI0035A90EFA
MNTGRMSQQAGDGVEDTVEGDDSCEAPLMGCRAARQVAAGLAPSSAMRAWDDAWVPGEALRPHHGIAYPSCSTPSCASHSTTGASHWP